MYLNFKHKTLERANNHYMPAHQGPQTHYINKQLLFHQKQQTYVLSNYTICNPLTWAYLEGAPQDQSAAGQWLHGQLPKSPEITTGKVPCLCL